LQDANQSRFQLQDLVARDLHNVFQIGFVFAIQLHVCPTLKNPAGGRFITVATYADDKLQADIR